jgi:hypothetical protein
LTEKISALVLCASPAQHAAVGDRVQQEQRERRLGRDSGNPRDRHVGAAGAVDELEVHEDRLPVPAEPDRDLLIAHLVEVQRGVALVSSGPGDGRPGQRRHVDLGLDPGDRDLRDLADLGGQRALLDEEHVGGEPGALVHRLDVRDYPGDLDGRLPGQLTAGDHHVVELQVLVRGQAHGELQRRRGHRAHHQADGIANGMC